MTATPCLAAGHWHFAQTALLDAALKETILLMMAWLAATALRRSSAAVRHRVWSLTMLGLLALPVLTWALPVWRLPISGWVAAGSGTNSRSAGDGWQSEVPNSPVPTAAVAAESVLPSGSERRESRVVASGADSAPTATAAGQLSWVHGAVMVWLIGASLCLSVMVVGLWQARRLQRRSRIITNPDWLSLLAVSQERLRLRRRVLMVEGEHGAVPMTWGLLRPVIWLPRESSGWPDALRRCVLLHELAHVKRCDVAWQLVVGAARAMYWFHPLAWWVARQSRLERERAADDCVLGMGERGADYAEQLLVIARTARRRPATAWALSMAGPGPLERRIRHLLDGSLSHAPISRRAAWLSLGLAVGAVTMLAVIAPAASTAADAGQETTADRSEAANRAGRNPDAPFLEPITGVVIFRGQPVAGATVVLREHSGATSGSTGDPVPTQTLAVVTTGPDGRFVFADVPQPDESPSNRESFPFPLKVVVASEDHAVSWQTLWNYRREPLEFVLDPPADLSGRVVGADGAPLADVGLRVRHFLPLEALVDLEQDGTQPRFGGNGSLDLGWPESPFQTRSGPDGTFRFAGLTPEAGIVLEIDDRRYLPTRVYVCADPEHPLAREARGGAVQSGAIEIHAQRGIHLRVRVVDAETGDPIDGARLPDPPTIHPPSAQTDADGAYDYYRLVGGRPFRLVVYPPSESGYLPAVAQIDLPSGSERVEQTVRLLKGQLVSGIVQNEETGAPIPGVPIHYLPRDRENASPAAFAIGARTNEDGRFQMAVPPGAAQVRIYGSVSGYVTWSRSGSVPDLPDQFERDIEAVEGAEPIEVRFELTPAPVVTGRVLDPKGKPVADVEITTRAIVGGGHRPVRAYSDDEGRFVISDLYLHVGAQDGEIDGASASDQAMVFESAERGLATVVAAPPPRDGRSPEPLEVTLEPTATVSGRVVDATGEPLSDALVFLYRRVSLSDRSPVYSEAVGRPVLTGRDGRFRLEHVVPGMSHHVAVRLEDWGMDARVATQTFTAEPGDDVALKTIFMVPEGVVRP